MKLRRTLVRGDFGVVKLFCDSDDVARLEAINADLLEAAKAVVERWDSPLWKDQEHTGTFIDRLWATIAKAEGEGV